MNWSYDDLKAYCERTGQAMPDDMKPKQPKYRNKPTVFDGKLHPSQHEANEVAYINLRWRAGEFPAYAEQVKFLLPGGVIYIADAVILKADMTYEIVEPKGVKTDAYKLKKKLMENMGIKITEV